MRWVMRQTLAVGVALLASSAIARAAAPVAFERRADVPWCAVVRAVRGPPTKDACTTPAITALVRQGARCTSEDARGGSIVTAEGPPVLEAPLVRALAALPAAEPDGAAVFVEGRRADAATPLPRRSLRAPPATDMSARGVVLTLAPAPGLFGVEGAALVLFLEDALAGVPGARAPRAILDADSARVLLQVPDTDEGLAAAVAAIDRAAARPLPQAQAELLRTRARGVVAERHATVGARARDRARAWLVTGASVLEDDADWDPALLGARVRARAFSAALARSQASAWMMSSTTMKLRAPPDARAPRAPRAR